MRRQLLVIVPILLLSSFVFGQDTNPNPALNVATNQGQFSLSAKVMSFKAANETVTATDLGATFAVTTTASLRSDNIIAPNGSQGFFGGLQYFLSSKKLLAKTNFDPSTFQFYATASYGVVRTGSLQQNGWLAGGGLNYDPTHASKFTVNLIEVRAANLPGVAHGVVPLVSGGLNLGW